MSGHSKWATIKHKKAKEDSKRGKVFTKIIKEITVAARVGGGDPSGNPRLRFLLDKAKAANMPIDNAMRAIKKGTGELEGVHYEQHFYEGYGPGHIAIIIEVLTDNKNRAIAELRNFFSKRGGTITETGAVGWMFEIAGVIHAHGDQITEDMLLENLLDYDIKDIYEEDNGFVISCEPRHIEEVKHVLTKLGMKIDEAEVEYVAKTLQEIPADSEEKVYDFLQGIEDLDDVQNVYSNAA